MSSLTEMLKKEFIEAPSATASSLLGILGTIAGGIILALTISYKAFAGLIKLSHTINGPDVPDFFYWLLFLAMASIFLALLTAVIDRLWRTIKRNEFLKKIIEVPMEKDNDLDQDALNWERLESKTNMKITKTTRTWSSSLTLKAKRDNDTFHFLVKLWSDDARLRVRRVSASSSDENILLSHSEPVRVHQINTISIKFKKVILKGTIVHLKYTVCVQDPKGSLPSFHGIIGHKGNIITAWFRFPKDKPSVFYKKIQRGDSEYLDFHKTIPLTQPQKIYEDTIDVPSDNLTYMYKWDW